MFFGKYPKASEPNKVGTYPSEVYSGGGYFYDEVLEYRVWLKEGGKSVYYAFSTYGAARKFSQSHKNTEKPIALVEQYSYIEETNEGLRKIDENRITEWSVDWLKGNRGTHEKIPAFIASHKDKKDK